MESISFAQDSYELAPGGSMTPEAIFTSDEPNVQPSFRDLTWTSSNTSVATVDKTSGKVTAVAEGTTKIRATASNDWAVKEGNPEVYGEYTLTVKKPVKAVNVGDYYYSDGDWSTERDNSKTVVGIVFAVGNFAVSDPQLLADKSTCSNGLVIGLKEGSAHWGEDNGPSANMIGTWLNDNGYPNIAATDKLGYGNTKGYNAMNTASPQVEYGGTTYTLKSTLCDYAKSYTPAAPSKSSGWYIPSYMEMQLIYGEMSKINDRLSTVSGVSVQSTNYHCSTMYKGYSYSFGAFNMSTNGWYMSSSHVIAIQDEAEYPIRVVLAF